MRNLLFCFLFPVAVAGAHENEDFLKQSRGANNPKSIDEWRKGEKRGGLKAYPPAPPGTPNPAGGLWQFGGGSASSYGGPDLGMPFSEGKAKMEKHPAPGAKAAAARVQSRLEPTVK